MRTAQPSIGATAAESVTTAPPIPIGHAATPVPLPVPVPEPEIEEKHRRLRRILLAHNADSLLLVSHGALAWLLGGPRVYVSLAGPPIVAARVTPDAITVHVTSNEARRLADEELSGVAIVERAWFAPLHATAELNEADVEAELCAARRVLLPAELARFRALCRDAAVVLGDALRAARADESERSLAARVGAGVIAVGADPLVILVAGSGRLGHRHPLPTDSLLGRRVMAVVCARRDGMIANLTRWIRFGAATSEETDATERILQVEADAFAALEPGGRLASLFSTIQLAYPANGFAVDEWERHHQGGPAGYNGRDPRLAPGVDEPIEAGQVFTLNPSAPGVKVEDTVLVTGVAGRPIEVLTVDPSWPTVRVRGLDRPGELEL